MGVRVKRVRVRRRVKGACKVRGFEGEGEHGEGERVLGVRVRVGVRVMVIMRV